jgi:acetyl-CoA carboxylase biotin carboxyl carrier protein
VLEVRAELVANVLRVLVTQGERVAEGDTLVFLESMKMEIPVLAEGSGTVSQLHVVEGDHVQEDELMLVIQ